MHELRKDYIFDRWVIVNTERAKRPKDFIKQHPKIAESGACAFCPGNESLTPPEIARVEENGKWVLRCFENKFPAVSTSGKPLLETKKVFFTRDMCTALPHAKCCDFHDRFSPLFTLCFSWSKYCLY